MGGASGPDLTHLASRATIAAGTLANEPAGLQRWLSDPKAIKPGAAMPAAATDQETLNALVYYLSSLH